MGKSTKMPRPSKVRPPSNGQRRSPDRIHSQDEINRHIADLMKASKRQRVSIDEFESQFSKEMSELKGTDVHDADIIKYRQELDKGRQKALKGKKKEIQKKKEANAPSESDSESEAETRKKVKTITPTVSQPRKSRWDVQTRSTPIIPPPRHSRWDVALPHWERTSSDSSDGEPEAKKSVLVEVDKDDSEAAKTAPGSKKEEDETKKDKKKSKKKKKLVSDSSDLCDSSSSSESDTRKKKRKKRKKNQKRKKTRKLEDNQALARSPEYVDLVAAPLIEIERTNYN